MRRSFSNTTMYPTSGTPSHALLCWRLINSHLATSGAALCTRRGNHAPCAQARPTGPTLAGLFSLQVVSSLWRSLDPTMLPILHLVEIASKFFRAVRKISRYWVLCQVGIRRSWRIQTGSGAQLRLELRLPDYN